MTEKVAEWFAEMTRGFDQDPTARAEYVKLVFSEEMGKAMEARGITNAELARRLGVSRAYITRIFHLNFNPTIETMLKIAIALNADLTIQLKPRGAANARMAESRRPHRAALRPYSRIEQAAVPIASDKPRKRRLEVQ
jgi:transcriptional regulator with XRE-family HTH domain